MTDARYDIVQNGKWFLANKAHFNYTEGAGRMAYEHLSKPVWPVNTDCSGFFTLCYYSAGANDPNGANYAGWGYTGTLLQHGIHVPAAQAMPGDAVVYGPGTGEHVALVVSNTNGDILTISHGQQGDPSYTWVNHPVHTAQQGYGVDGRQPQTFLRFNTTKVRPAWKLA